MSFDIDKVRRDTPITDRLAHFNNAGTSLSPKPVFEAVIQYLQQEQDMGGYEIESQREADLQDFYAACAELLNCDADEIAFSDSATRSWQQFFYAVPLSKGQRIITTRIDYGSNFVGYLQQQQRTGAEICVVDCDDNGDIDLEQMRREVDDRTALIAISHIPTGSGLINPAVDVGVIAKQANVPYLLDACQSVGQINVDVKEIGCTALSVTGRKYLRGPRGTGFLYVDKAQVGQYEPPCLDQHGVELHGRDGYTILPDATRFETYENHVGGKLGLAKAVRYALDLGMPEIETRIKSVGTELREKLGTVAGITLQDDGSNLGGIVTFSSKKHSAADIKATLGKQDVNVWVSAGSGSLVDFQARGIDSVVRASVHYFNTSDEIDRLIHALHQMG